MDTAQRIGLLYLAAISIAAAAITLYDKSAAKLGWRRIPEARLLLIAALGGSAAMFAVMLLIRHKTRHVKFMAGLPVILFLQAALAVFAFFNFR